MRCKIHNVETFPESYCSEIWLDSNRSTTDKHYTCKDCIWSD